MVKKIDGTTRPPVTGTAPVEAGKGVANTAKVGSVGQVTAAQAQAPASGVRRPTRPMSAAEREHLMRLLHEEADRLFGADGLPQEKKEKVEKAVQMAITSGVVDENDIKKK